MTDFPLIENKKQEYQEARKEMWKHFLGSKDLVSLYEFGSVGAPSVSDIDFLVVLKDKPSEDIHKFLDRKLMDKRLQYLMMDNTLMIVNQDGFRNIPVWDNMKCSLLHGKEIEQVDLGEAVFYTEIARVLDWLPERLLRLMELIVRKEVPVRVTLCVINSFVYTLQRLKNVFGIKTSYIDEFIRGFRNLRIRWHYIPNNKEQLYDFLCCGIKMGFYVLREFDDYLRKAKFYDPVNVPRNGIFRLNPTITTWTTNRMYYHFSGLEDVSLEESVMWSKTILNSAIIKVPDLYYQHLAVYSQSKGPVGAGIRKNMFPIPQSSVSQGMDRNLRRVLERRMEVCNQMATFLRENNIKKGLLKFGWFL